MADALTIATSGLMAQRQRLDASASNIANASTTGPLPTPESPASTVYKPLNVSYTSLTGGGVLANVTADQNGYTPVFNPADPNANSDGLVAAPNVDLGQEIVNVMETKLLYKADASVIKTQDKMLGDLIDTIS